MNSYRERALLHRSVCGQLEVKIKRIRLLRFILGSGFLAAIVYFFLDYQWPFFVLFLISLAAFVVAVFKHQQLADKLLFEETLAAINEKEELFLMGQHVSDKTGEHYAPKNHAYAQDLDIFGEHSLFRYLHRSGTYSGEKHLAESLLSRPTLTSILDHQQVIRELTPLIEWRQKYMAHAQLSKDSESKKSNLERWAAQKAPVLSRFARFCSFALPAVFLACLIAFIISGQLIYLNFTALVFTLQLMLIASHIRMVLGEVNSFEEAKETLHHYASLIQLIEDQNVNAPLFQQVKKELRTEKKTSSVLIRQLESYIASLSNVQNLFGATLFNGFGSYHLRLYNRYQLWKEEHAAMVRVWIESIGKVEQWNLQANFAYNNPCYIYPTWHTERSFEFIDVAHPFIPEKVRVGNSIAFSNDGIMILTGSNMSGKSTFLRTIGINFVLAQSGMPVCAKSAHLSVKNIVVSMRMSDSLADQKSYFFAEILRLKNIIDGLNEQTFLLLDELLRGTNSDDKRQGTIGLLHSLRLKNAQGILATHDLEVCAVSNEFSTYFRNACFEVDMEEDQLHFDYTLRDGICKNKNASYLLKKYGIIA